MKPPDRLVLIVIFGLFLSGCSRIVADPNFTLGSGEQVRGSLVLLSTNATLQEGSQVSGSVYMLCCNLTIDGEVGGSAGLLSGNFGLGPHALIHERTSIGNGNYMEAPGSQVMDQQSAPEDSSGFVLRIVLMALLPCLAFVVLFIVLIAVLIQLFRRNRSAPANAKPASS